MKLTLTVNMPFAIGELVDKVTILEIKIEHFSDPSPLHSIISQEGIDEKLKWCAIEYKQLMPLIEPFSEKIEGLREELKKVNRKLWDIETKIRAKEMEEKFDDEFISLARSVYKTNDERHQIKSKINEETNSDIREQKEYNLATGWPEGEQPE